MSRPLIVGFLLALALLTAWLIGAALRQQEQAEPLDPQTWERDVPDHVPQPLIVIDGDMSDWPEGTNVAADPHWLYFRLNLHDNHAVRVRDLEQLEQIAGRYRSRSKFITDLTLDPPSSTQDLAGPPLLDEDYLILSTIHSAKAANGTWFTSSTPPTA